MTITTYATNTVVLTMIISLKIMTSATKLKRLWSTSFPYILQEVRVERRVKVGNGKMSKQEERKQRKRRKREEERKKEPGNPLVYRWKCVCECGGGGGGGRCLCES